MREDKVTMQSDTNAKARTTVDNTCYTAREERITQEDSVDGAPRRVQHVGYPGGYLNLPDMMNFPLVVDPS